MNENQKEQIIKMAKVLAPSYVETLREAATTANKKIDRIAGLLILVAFSSLSLSIQLLSKEGLDTNIIRWGLFFLITSVLFGFIQILVDSIYWAKRVKPNQDIATNFTLISTEVFGENNILDAREALKDLQNMPNNSNTICLWLETVFVIIGGLMILSQLLF